MNFYILLLILFTLLYTVFTETPKKRDAYDRSLLHNELNRELRNYLCCKKNMKCCKRRAASPPVEIRAVLTRCPQSNYDSNIVSRRFRKPLYSVREGDLKSFQGFDEDEPLCRSAIKNCRKKLILTMKTSSDNIRRDAYEYIVVDHAYDSLTKKKRRLLIPYVVKFKQEPVIQMYAMKFLHVVNSHVREEVINKHSSNFTGCDTKSYRPTCGRIKYLGKVVPYSEGFCCSCDSSVNKKRQPTSVSQYSDNIISYSDPAFLLDGIECPKYAKGPQGAKETQKVPGPTYQSVVPEVLESYGKGFETNTTPVLKAKPMFNEEDNDYYSENLNYYNVKEGDDKRLDEDTDTLDVFPEDVESNIRLVKRQVQASGAQKRGGQNCADRYTPKGLNPDTYHESAHCLRFSDLWYTVYRLQAPVIEHSISFQVFEKHEDMEGRVIWKDVTAGKAVRVGTLKPYFIDTKGTISIKYTSKPIEADLSKFAIDYRSALFLVPEGVQNCDIKDYPEIMGGPPEYLIVHSSQVSLDGDQCNVAGVGFEAFFKQPNRCAKPKGTCLLNQPYHLWKHDHLAEKTGKKGCFFLRFYGKLPKDPIRKYLKTNEQFLALEYLESYPYTVDFEIKADFNTVIRPHAPAVITEVYVDSTSPKKTALTIKITNSGLIASSFIAKLSDCPLEMPASFNNIESKPVLIPPQQQHIFHLNIKCILPTDRFHCSVEALNSKRELMALRRIRIQKLDRCICTWHCLCACVGSSEGLKCIPMSLHQYHAAGFQGSMPVLTYLIQYSLIDEIFSFVMYILLFLILILLMLGLCKALIGIFCSPAIGILGLDVVLDLPKPIIGYYEMELRGKRVEYDDEGWPIHPVTKERVRSIGRPTEFCMNLIFFFAYPTNVLVLLLKRIFCFPCTYADGKSGRVESVKSTESNKSKNRAQSSPSQSQISDTVNQHNVPPKTPDKSPSFHSELSARDAIAISKQTIDILSENLSLMKISVKSGFSSETYSSGESDVEIS